MTTPPDPASTGLEAIKEAARAVQETAKLGAEVTRAASGGGRWLDGMVGDALRDTIGLLWGDRVRAARIEAAITNDERLLGVFHKAQARLAANGSSVRRDFPPKLGLALFAAASEEEDDDLQTLWANLLASAVDEKADTVEQAYVSILRDLSVEDAAALGDYFENWSAMDKKPYSADHVTYGPAMDGDQYGARVVANFFRLGLVEPSYAEFENYEPEGSNDHGVYGDETHTVRVPTSLSSFVFTDLGVAFCKAVGMTVRPKERISLARGRWNLPEYGRR